MLFKEDGQNFLNVKVIFEKGKAKKGCHEVEECSKQQEEPARALG